MNFKKKAFKSPTHSSIIRFISNPVFEYTNNEVKIVFFYYFGDRQNLSTRPKSYKYWPKKDASLSSNQENCNTLVTSGHKFNSISSTSNVSGIQEPSLPPKKRSTIWTRDNKNFLSNVLPTPISTQGSSNLQNLIYRIEQLHNGNKKITLQCNRIYYPYMNRDILAKYIAHNCSSNTFLNIQEMIRNRINIGNTSSNTISLFSAPSPALSLLPSPERGRGIKGNGFRGKEDELSVNSIGKSETAMSVTTKLDPKVKNIKNNFVTSVVTGVKVKISGRITTESIIPRITEKSFQIGSFKKDFMIDGDNRNFKNISLNNINNFSRTDKLNIKSNYTINSKNVSYFSKLSLGYRKPNFNTVDSSEYTTKNRIGAFTIKVWISSIR